ncbi:MAG TPA: RNA polymerase sigma factor [Thermoanaerobaculia bacterium]
MSDASEEKYQDLLRYYDSLVKFIRSLGFDLEDARDLAQDVFLRVYEHRDDYRGEAKWNFLLQVARRLAYNEFRDRNAGKRKGIHVPEDALVEQPDRGPRPDKVVLRKEVAQRLSAAIHRLDEGQRICVTLFYIDDLTYQEICNFLGISEPALKSRLNAARKRLKELLGEEPAGWRDLPPGSGNDS